MPLRITCSAGHKLVVPSDQAHRPIHCPRCGEAIVADGAAADNLVALPDMPAIAPVTAPPIAPRAARSRWPAIRATAQRPESRPRLPQAAGLLAGAILAAALFSVAPAVFEIAEAWRSAEPPLGFLPARWALVLCWLALLQATYGIYLWRWNDWGSARVVAVALVALAGSYAAALAVVLFADPRGWIAGSEGLQFAEKLAGGKAAMWCLCLVSLSTSLAYFAAQLSMRWQQAELLSPTGR